MKKLLFVFIGLIMIVPAMADEEPVVVPPAYPESGIASPAYVKGAYDALNTAKMPQLQNNAATPADISSTVKTTLETTVSDASDTSMVTEKAIATVLQNKVDTVTDATNTYGATVVTGISKSNGTVTVTKGEITIPVTSYSAPTAHAQIWLQ